MPIPGAAIRLGRVATGLEATFQATTCRHSRRGYLRQPLRRLAYPRTPARLDSPAGQPGHALAHRAAAGLLAACNLSRSQRSSYCAITHADPGAACCAITHACGWACAITHVLLWMDLCYHPQAYCAITHKDQKKHVKNQLHNPLFQRRNARAHFLTFKIFNATEHKLPVDNSILLASY